MGTVIFFAYAHAREGKASKSASFARVAISLITLTHRQTTDFTRGASRNGGKIPVLRHFRATVRSAPPSCARVAPSSADVLPEAAGFLPPAEMSSRGTGSSNPSPSSGESIANPTSSPRRTRRATSGGRPRCEPAGGVARRVGEGLPPSHHLGEQPPGDGAEREAVMGMAEGEPQALVPLAFANHRDHVGKTGPPAHPRFGLQPFGQGKQFAGQRFIARKLGKEINLGVKAAPQCGKPRCSSTSSDCRSRRCLSPGWPGARRDGLIGTARRLRGRQRHTGILPRITVLHLRITALLRTD